MLRLGVIVVTADFDKSSTYLCRIRREDLLRIGTVKKTSLFSGYMYSISQDCNS